jgi:hypothetical protein
MTPNLLSLYVSLSAEAAVLHCVRSKAGHLVSLQATADEPEMTKGQTFQLFTPNEMEAQFIDLVAPKQKVKADPMADRLRKSQVERPVQYVLRVVRENPQLERKALIELCVAEGVADYTARTQVQVGLKRRKALAELFARNAAAQAAADEANEAEQEAEGAAMDAYAEGSDSNDE